MIIINNQYTIKYNTRSTRIKSNWFDTYERKQNTYEKMGNWQGLYLYFNLYKFKINTDDDIFITSIQLLEMVTGYQTIDIFNLLLKLRKAKVIKFNNISRTDQLLLNDIKIRDCDKDENNHYVIDKKYIDINRTLIISANDLPETIPKQVNGVTQYIPIDNGNSENKYIYIPFVIFEIYEQLKFNGRYYALFSLMNKWNNNIEKKAYMSIEKMEDRLHIDKDTINRMIRNMNKNYLLYSAYRKRPNKDGFYFEHHLADSLKMIDWIKRNYKEEIDNRYK